MIDPFALQGDMLFVYKWSLPHPTPLGAPSSDGAFVWLSVLSLTENTLKLSLPLWASEVYFVSEVILRIVKFCIWQSGQT